MKSYPPQLPLRFDTDWHHQLGPEWQRLAAAKRRFDPDGVLRPGTDVFG